MAEELKFYYSLNETIPTEKKNGNIYFILDEDKKIGNIKVDLENQRYDIKPEYDLANSEQAGLMSPEDKNKLIPISIKKESNSDLQIGINDDNTNFNFLRDIFINDSQVLTQDSLAQVEVTTVNQGQTPEESSSIEIVKYIDENNKDKYKLKLKLALPDTFKGEKGDSGEDGSDGKDGIDGKDGQSSIIKDITWNFSNEENEEPSISVSQDTVLNEETNTNETALHFDFNNLKGERGYQGQTIGLDFNFISGPPLDEGIVIQNETPELYTDDNGNLRQRYTIHVPQGIKGDTGIPFKISQTFSTIADMEEARQNAEQGDENFIPLETFVLIEGDPTIEANGSLFFRELNGTCTKISDIIPVQPVFSTETTTLDSNQNAEVIIDNGLNNAQASTPTLKFKIPRGKQLEAGNIEVNIDKNFGDISTEGSKITTSGDVDNKQLNLKLNLKNMGTITPIGIGTITKDNTSLAQPEINVTPRISEDGVTQLLDFDFKGLKGQKGDAADSFDTSNTGITAEYITDALNPSPRAKVDAVNGNDGIQLAFKFYNLKGDMGELKGINSSGVGNAITSIELDNTKQNFVNIYKDSQFATEEYSKNADNINSGTVKVSNGGTGLNNIPLNSIVIGNGNNILKTTNSKLGALYSEGNNQEPKFGTLPPNAGGTGNQGIARNAILVGNNNDPMTPISTKSGAFFATGNGYTPDFGTLPVPQGGTGSYTHQNNSILIGKDGADLGHISSKAGAFYSTGTNAEPQFGILPVTLGGTGAITAEQARINIGSPRAEIEVNSVQPTVQPENTIDYILSFTNVLSPINNGD